MAILALAGACALAPSTGDLAAEREAAVLRGLRFLATALADPGAVPAVRIDCVMIFLEAGATSSSMEVRRFAMAEARRQARRLADIRLADPLPMAAPELLDLIDLAGEAEWLDLDPAPLVAKARAALEHLPRPNGVYGTSPVDRGLLASATEWGLLDILLTAYSLEKASVAGFTFGTTFGLPEVLGFLADHRFVPAPAGLRGGEFKDSVFLASHVVFVASDYGRVAPRDSDAPAACEYLRRVFPRVLESRDVELVGEVLDVHRSLGVDEAVSPLVAEASRFLLDAQNPDGSWGDPGAAGDAYDAVHPTWCAVMGLRDRTYLAGTAWERRIRAIFGSLGAARRRQGP